MGPCLCGDPECGRCFPQPSNRRLNADELAGNEEFKRHGQIDPPQRETVRTVWVVFEGNYFPREVVGIYDTEEIARAECGPGQDVDEWSVLGEFEKPCAHVFVHEGDAPPVCGRCGFKP